MTSYTLVKTEDLRAMRAAMKATMTVLQDVDTRLSQTTAGYYDSSVTTFQIATRRR